MHLCEIRPISSLQRFRLSAFRAQGVPLKHSWTSWSGVRSVDGVVIFAIPAAAVEADDSGCRCLLWSRATDARFGRRASDERLAHCRLAVCHGSAEGILVPANARVASSETFGLRVEPVAGQYWALWGLAAQSRRAGSAAPRLRFASCATG